MKILESAENYLESILILRNEKGRVRSIDIVNHLGFSKPSDETFECLKKHLANI